jgi:dTDP-4-amino-4,6-dideoxygalactose transaminase
VTDELAERFVWLPCGHQVDEDDIGAIVGILELIAAQAGDVKRLLAS